METQNKMGQCYGVPMILFGILLVGLLFLTESIIGGFRLEEYLLACWDLSAFLSVLLGVSLYVLVRGWQNFYTGIQTIFYCPAGNQKIAAYFRGLTAWTLGVGFAGAILASTISIFFGTSFRTSLMTNANYIGCAIAPALLSFAYAGWLAVMVFLPISIRHSALPENTEPPLASLTSWRLPIGAALVGITEFFLVRAAMALIAFVIKPETYDYFDLFTVLTLLSPTLLSVNPAGSPADPSTAYLMPNMWWDLPSLMLILISFLAFRLAAGQLRNRLDWIPVCILVGVLWSTDGLNLMLCDLDPESFASGCFAAMIPVLYGFIAAPLVVLDKKGICRKTALVTVAFTIVYLLCWYLPASIGIIKG